MLRKLIILTLIPIGMFATKLATAAAPPVGCSMTTSTGCVTKNVPDQVQEGYTLIVTLLDDRSATYLVDSKGKLVKIWPTASFSKALPNGHLLSGYYFPDTKPGLKYVDCIVEQDFHGKVVWPAGASLIDSADGTQKFCDPTAQVVALTTDSSGRPHAAMHHEVQRKNNPVGYFSPNQTAILGGGTTLALANVFPGIVEKISDFPLWNDHIYEFDVDNKTRVLWKWDPVDHIDPPPGSGDLGLGFSAIAKAAVRTKQIVPFRQPAHHLNKTDWLHSNSVAYVGLNKWCTDVNSPSCDHRFDPDNVIWNTRVPNITAIIARKDRPGFWKSGDIVWRLGPDFNSTPGKVDQMIGTHFPHIIPQGLPGAGNMLIFDNGGAAGYGADENGQPGSNIKKRPFSRVIEFNPVTLDIVWMYQRPNKMPLPGENYAPFFSGPTSSAQRLQNGNTLIAEGAGGRAFEVTQSGQLVWEFVNPIAGPQGVNGIYRAYRVPLNWVPGSP